MNLFSQKIVLSPVDLSITTCHSGGATGSDTYFSEIGKEFGVSTKAYSYKTKYHQSDDKVEISDDDYNEGVDMINKANHILKRYGIQKYMNLLARNWAQVKYSGQTIAIGTIVEPNSKTSKGYNKSSYQVVDGGTGYAVCMSIQQLRPVFVFDQVKGSWFEWSHSLKRFITCDVPIITDVDFAGIGTRNINELGVKAIRDVYMKTLQKYNESKGIK